MNGTGFGLTESTSSLSGNSTGGQACGKQRPRGDPGALENAPNILQSPGNGFPNTWTGPIVMGSDAPINSMALSNSRTTQSFDVDRRHRRWHRETHQGRHRQLLFLQAAESYTGNPNVTAGILSLEQRQGQLTATPPP